jgi:O-antigen ligase
MKLFAVGALLAWGVLSFGAVYPWAYEPLTLGTLVVGAWLYLSQPGRSWRGAALAAGLLLIPVLLQQLPVPATWIETMAPANVRLRDALYVGLPQRQWLPLTVSPAATTRLLIFLAAGIVWVAGLKHVLHKQIAPASLAVLIIAIGTVVALEGLIQQATFNGKIYWFWESFGGVTNNYFGPFVNRNHFAGWMLMAGAIGAGFFIGSLTSIPGPYKPGLRERILWLGTRDVSYALLTGSALAIMMMSIIWTRSRSGAIGTSVMVVLLAVAAFAEGGRRAARRAAAMLIVLLIGGAIWKGVDALGSWYADTTTLEWRLVLWQDSLPALRDLWRFGSGLNTYGLVMLVYPQTDLSVHAQQAHNDYLQLAIEGGALVLVPWLLGAITFASIAWRKLRAPQDQRTWWIRAGALAGLCGIAVQEISDFSLQMPGAALLFATAIAIVLHEPSPADHSKGQRRRRSITPPTPS